MVFPAKAEVETHSLIGGSETVGEGDRDRQLDVDGEYADGE